ncbi:MAG: ribonuclease HI family protein [Dehalococcoidales bacterium]|nr:ribonuclease HI family protein [Dehalococcoidales bacterium]
MNKLVIHTDGGARGNPGPAGIGYVIECESKILEKKGECIGEATNNIAEYAAIIKALKAAKKYNPKEIECFLDSELVVKQVKGEYKAKDPKMRELLNQLRELVFFKAIEFSHIRREKNKEADALVNKALDDAGF